MHQFQDQQHLFQVETELIVLLDLLYQLLVEEEVEELLDQEQLQDQDHQVDQVEEDL